MVYGSRPIRKRPAESRPLCWADRDDSLGGLPLPSWLDAGGTVPNYHIVRGAILSSAFSSVLSNVERRKFRSSFPTPDMPVTRCPRLDPIFKVHSVKADIKSLDSELARIQAFLLDPVGPLTCVLEGLERKDAPLDVNMLSQKLSSCWAMPLLSCLA